MDDNEFGWSLLLIVAVFVGLTNLVVWAKGKAEEFGESHVVIYKTTKDQSRIMECGQ